MRIMFIDVKTMQERPGKFIKQVTPYKGKIVTDTGETLVLDIDDFWAAE
jgi:hypothetical protein